MASLTLVIVGTPVQLGQYVDSHSDSVTQLMFHPSAPSQLVSASEDGLLCVFDVRAKSEDDALVTVIPTDEGCPSAVGLFGPSAAFVYCATDMGGLSLWNLATAEPVAVYSPQHVRAAAQKSRVRAARSAVTRVGMLCAHSRCDCARCRSRLLWTASIQQPRNG